MYYCDEKGDIKILDLRESKPHLKFSAGIDINCATLAPNQYEIFYGDSNGIIGRLDLRTERLTQKFKASPNDDFGIHSLTLTMDSGNLIFGDSGGNVVFASLEKEEDIKMLNKKRFHSGIVMNCEISKDKKFVVTSSTDHSIKIFTFEEGGEFLEHQSINQHNGWVWGLKILQDSQMFLAASSDSYITVWGMKDGKLVKEVENDIIDGRGYSVGVNIISLIFDIELLVL